MEETLISFETAVLAKKKGFKEATHSLYFEDGEFKENELTGTNGYYGEEYCFNLAEFYENWNSEWVTKKNMDRCFGCNKSKGYLETYSAPTQGLLQKWLREVHGIFVNVETYNYESPGSFYFIPTIDFQRGHKLLYTKISSEFVILHKNKAIRGEIKNTTKPNAFEEVLETGLFEALKLIE